MLTSSDLTYVGRFGIPDSLGGLSTLDGTAFAGRYVGGSLRFFLTVYGPGYAFNVIEINNPGYSTSSPPNATLNRDWGDIYHDKRYLGQDPAGMPAVLGLYWDATDSRLYWSFGNAYGDDDDDFCLGYSTLNNSNGSSAAFGPWTSAAGYKACQGGLLAIPSDFRTAHLTSAQRLAMGMGGYFSVVGAGPASMGPAIFAFNPSSLPAEEGTITVETLLNYPYNATEYTNPDRFHRSTDYDGGFDDGWLPHLGVGYWQWSDVIKQGGVWIQNATKHGVFFAGLLGTQTLSYVASDREAEGGKHFFCVYDPEDVGDIVDGAVQPYAVQPASVWYHQFQGMSYPLDGWRGDGVSLVQGVWYDETTRLLYVRVKYDGVFVFEVAD